MKQYQQVIVVGLIKNELGEILLGLRNQPERPNEHNKWEFPGGGIEFGETPEAALKREVKEEAGLDIRILRLLPKAVSNLWQHKGSKEQVIILAYECKILGGELKSSDAEVSELKFFKINEIDYSKCLPKTDEIISLILNP